MARPPHREEMSDHSGSGPPPQEFAGLPEPGRNFLTELLRLQLLGGTAAGIFLREAADLVPEFDDPTVVGKALVQSGHLTPYQFERIMAGTTHGLVLGNHRVLDRLGAGSMGVVFLAEHLLLKRRVAVKVLPVDDGLPPAILERFYAEMRVLADLHHPNIVMAFDAGRLPPQGPTLPALHYLVMELVGGGDLEQHVVEHGPVPVPQACEWTRQAACGLQAAHDQHLIHRDLKPSNLLLTKDNQVKLVDFGLVRQLSNQMKTDPRALLGSIEFMSPEQSLDPSGVGGPADIYGLGATLFWVLTGQTPYPPERSVAKALRALQQDRPRRVRDFLPDVPPELDSFINRMLDRDPAQRPQLPVAVMNALARFAAPAAPPWEIFDPESPPAATPGPTGPTLTALLTDQGWRVLIVDDDAAVRQAARAALEPLGCVCGEAPDGESAQTAAENEPYDLVLLDLHLPGISGYDVCLRLRERPPRPHLKVVLMSAHGGKNELAEALAQGADDFVAKPFDPLQLAAKLQYMLRLKDAQDRADLLARHLLASNRQLEHSLQARASDVRQAHNALLFAMAKMAESRDEESPGHLRRMQRYCRRLARQLAKEPAWSGVVSDNFLEELERCVPLHDIGKISLPDALLSKPGPFEPEERALIETHPVVGAGILDAVARQFGDSLAFLAAATVIVRYHHERYDGQGYPEGLVGDAIPPAARIVALADLYDALRRKRFHKPPLSHAQAVPEILERSPGRFDPVVLRAFSQCQDDFRQIFEDVRN
jgi:response regulator RpfG family c-di-GMP phosphodiesterase/serine/threonine protein kinase